MDKKLEALYEALAQQRKYERENWPFVDDQDKPTGTGESISYHLASNYCWSPEYVLSLPPAERDECLREIWRTFSIAGDIIKRYEDATTALEAESLEEKEDRAYQAMEAALQVLAGNINNQRAELLLIKAAVMKESEE